MKHELIMENWRGYIAREAISGLPTVDCSNTRIFLREGKQIKQVKFGYLLEQLDSGKLSYDKFSLVWEQSVNYEYNLLLEAGIFDLVRRGWEAVKAGGKRAFEALPDSIKAAWVKATSFMQNSISQAMAAFDGTIVRAKIAIDNINQAITKFGEDNPLLVTGAKIGVALIAATALAKLMQSGVADAAVVDSSGVALPQKEVDTMLGWMSDAISGAETINNKTEIMSQMAELQQAHESTGKIPLDELSKYIQLVHAEIGEIDQHMDAILEASEAAIDAKDETKARFFLKVYKGMAEQMASWQEVGANTNIQTTTRGGVGF